MYFLYFMFWNYNSEIILDIILFYIVDGIWDGYKIL
jgi:hypothetical protein